jgi:putative pyruvate formate lyase activating enzyme
MHRQVGDLQINEWDTAERGLLIRHLVMPQGLADTRDIMHFIAKEISCNAYVNIMNQYRPEYKSCNFPELNRGITHREYHEAIAYAHAEGLSKGFPQG